MRAYLEIFDNPSGLIRLTHDNELSHGKRTPYFRSVTAQIIQAPPNGVIGLYGLYDGVASEDQREAMMRCLYGEGFEFADWERWEDGQFRKMSRVRIRAEK